MPRLDYLIWTPDPLYYNIRIRVFLLQKCTKLDRAPDAKYLIFERHSLSSLYNSEAILDLILSYEIVLRIVLILNLTDEIV